MDCWQRQASGHMEDLMEVYMTLNSAHYLMIETVITAPFLNGLVLGAEVISIECHLCYNNEI